MKKLLTVLFTTLFLLQIGVLAQRKTDSIEYLAVADKKIACDSGEEKLCFSS